MAASRYGPRPAYGVGSTGRCWTNSGPGARWIGHRQSSTRPPFAPKGGSLVGPNPVDRGKKGSELHVLSDAQGVSFTVAVSGANMHDSLALKPLILGIPAIRSRRGSRRRRPVKLRADKASFSAEHLAWLRERGLVARIARPGIESGERLGRHRWKIERSIAWLFGYRRLTVRYERKGSHFLAFLGLAAALTCYKKLATLATCDTLCRVTAQGTAERFTAGRRDVGALL
ncbi:transposase [Streptomyces sp. NPDC050516]|uniref:transposase n=1 Tax=Streptomyces sp. NPDC050516 TaxID=3365621 RepID=UPI0037AC84A0